MKRRLWWPLRFIWQFRALLSIGAVIGLLFHGWTNPPARSVGDLIRSTDYNTYIKDNLNYLFSGRPGQIIKRDNGASYTTTSTTFVDIDATNLAITTTINSGKVLIAFNGGVQNLNVGSGSGASFDVSVDGTRYASGGTEGIQYFSPLSSAQIWITSFTIIVTGLSIGSHTFKIQWKAANANGIKLNSGDGSATTDTIPSFAVGEIG